MSTGGQNNYQIKVEVVRWEGSGGSPYSVYALTVQDEGAGTTKRVEHRYSAYSTPYERILSIVPSSSHHLVPPFPPKASFWENQRSTAFIEQRRKDLESFFRSLFANPSFLSLPPLLEFLPSSSVILYSPPISSP